MARAASIAALLALLLAGCQEAPAPEAPPPQAVVEGLALDAALRPVAGATATLRPMDAEPLTAEADQDGRFVLASAAALAGTVTVAAPGFAPSSQQADVAPGGRAALTFLLERLPDERPYAVVEEFQGVLRCAAAVAIHTTPGQPHQDRTARCTDAVPLEQQEHVWDFRPDRNATAVVLEAAWEPQTPVSQALTLRATDAATGAVIGFAEGTSVLRLQLGQVHVQSLAATGGTLRVEVIPGAGTGDHEEGAVGAFVEQPFELFATTFHNMPAPATYSVAKE